MNTDSDPADDVNDCGCGLPTCEDCRPENFDRNFAASASSVIGDDGASGDARDGVGAPDASPESSDRYPIAQQLAAAKPARERAVYGAQSSEGRCVNCSGVMYRNQAQCANVDCPGWPCAEKFYPKDTEDRFGDEDGKDWFLVGTYSRDAVLAEFYTDAITDPPEITVVRGRIEYEPEDIEMPGGRLCLDPCGKWEFWQAEGGTY